MRKNHLSEQGGFSTIELIIVLVVIGVLCGVAVLQLNGARNDLQRQKIVREFKTSLERARFDSVKRRAMTNADMSKVILNSATSFTERIDYNEDGTLSTAETRSVDFTQGSATQILVTDTLNYPVTISFNQRGHVTAIDGLGNSINPVFRICSNCTAASPDVSYISISPSGTVADTRTAPSALPTPVINGNISSNALNCYVLVNTNAACVQF